MANERMNRTMYLVLVSGMVLSFCIMIVGLVVVRLDAHRRDDPALGQDTGGHSAREIPSRSSIWASLSLSPRRWSGSWPPGITFGMEKDYRFVGISVFVLVMIVLAVFIRL